MPNQILGTIHFVVPTSKLVHLSSWMLFFTDSGIIVADLGGKYVTETLSAMLAGELAGGSIGTIGAGYAVSGQIKKQVDEAIAKMSQEGPEFILNDNKSNFQIAYPDIVRLELKRGGWIAHTSITIITADKKFSFDLTGTHGPRTKNMIDDSDFASYLGLIKKTGINDKLSLR